MSSALWLLAILSGAGCIVRGSEREIQGEEHSEVRVACHPPGALSMSALA
jgi:hypothetical protein